MPLVLWEQQGPIGTLTLNNPESLNAMTEAMGEAIQAQVPQINQIADLRVVIVKGAGRAFSAGGDLNFILRHTKQTPEENQAEMVEFYGKFLSIRKIVVPTIAMLHGPAIGAGFMVALACDLRYAATPSKMAANFAKLGLSSGMGSLYWLTRLAGSARAADLLFTGRTILADEAERFGLINEALEPEALEEKVMSVAKQIAVNAPVALKVMKQGIQEADLASIEDVFHYESQGQAKTFATQDLVEGVAAIKEKRAPQFSGE